MYDMNAHQCRSGRPAPLRTRDRPTRSRRIASSDVLNPSDFAGSRAHATGPLSTRWYTSRAPLSASRRSFNQGGAGSRQEPSHGFERGAAVEDFQHPPVDTAVRTAGRDAQAVGGSKVDDPTDISEFRKIGCASVQPEEGHVCEFRMTLNGNARPGMKARFAKGPDGKLTMDDREKCSLY